MDVYSLLDMYRPREKYWRGTIRRYCRALKKNFFDFFVKNNKLQDVKNKFFWSIFLVSQKGRRKFASFLPPAALAGIDLEQ